MLAVGSQRNLNKVLYLISIMLPSPIIVLASYLLRYRPTPTNRERGTERYQEARSTRGSVVRHGAAELPLPLPNSAGLAPVDEKQDIGPQPRDSHFVVPIPSVSSLNSDRTLRPHTVHGFNDAQDQLQRKMRDRVEEARLRTRMHRRSTDVWLEEGLAVEGGSRWSRTAEMLKPRPALCVLDAPRPRSGLLSKIRGGVVSMMPKLFSVVMENHQLTNLRHADDNNVPSIPLAISSDPPSNIIDHRRAGRLSDAATNGDGLDGDSAEAAGNTSAQLAEIQIATKGRMSVSPVIFSSQPGSAAIVKEQSGYELDWMTAGVLPK